MRFNVVHYILLIILFISCDNNQTESKQEMASNEGIAKIEFEEEMCDFGEIKQGEKVVHTYWFINTGTSDLIVTDVIPSCGCTVPTYDKNPIAPNEKGKIKVRFNSSGRNGAQYKTIKVNTNAENGKVTLSFKATIIE